MKKILLFTFIFAVSALSTFAQFCSPGEPYTFKHKDISMYVTLLDMPTIDNAKLLEEDAAIQDKGMPLRVAVLHTVNLNMNNSGRWDIMKNGDRVWRVGIKSADALAISCIFSEFDIPKGGEVYIYSPDHQYVIGMFDSRSVLPNGEFYTQEIPGDELILEYYEPVQVAYKGKIAIQSVEHTYRGHDVTKGYHGSAVGDCHINTICPDADPWRDQVNSVVCIKLSTNSGTYLCSGAMINNTRQDNTPYVFTAEHCWENGATWRFYFHYETNTCDVNYGGIYNRVAIGAELRAKDNRTVSSDFMLLEITGAINDNYKEDIFFAGWNRSSGIPSIGVCIHHPGGDYKKISFPRLVANGGTSYPKFWAATWFLDPNNRGVTEGGSSGSPLFNAQKYIVGSLCCGSSSCVPDAAENVVGPSGYDYYGKFSNSWFNNNNANTSKKLQPWLDPDNWGNMALAGRYWNQTIGIHESVQETKSFTVSPNPSNGDVSISGTFPIGNGICTVYDLLGKIVYTTNLTLDEQMVLNLNFLNNGVYIVEIEAEGYSYRTKMIITK